MLILVTFIYNYYIFIIISVKEVYILVTFGERIRMERLKRNLSLDKLAEDLGTTKQSLSRYENNQREPKLFTLTQLADYFNCSADYLLGRTDNREGIIIKEVIQGHDIEVEVDKSVYPNGVSKEDIMKALDLIKSTLDQNFSHDSTEK